MLIKDLIDSKSLNKDIFKDVLFFSLAEGGAMGVPGEIIVVNKSPRAFAMESVYGDVDVSDVVKMFPVLEQCRFGMFGLDSEVPEGWNYVNLGMGNHLIVADEVYDEFCRLTKDCKREVEYHGAWQEAAAEILGLETDGDKNA